MRRSGPLQAGLDLFGDSESAIPAVDRARAAERLDHYRGCLSAVTKSSLRSQILTDWFRGEVQRYEKDIV